MVLAVSKAVVPVAGLGTRLLPVTKAQPKEMLPVASRPLVQYVIEELAHCGISEVLFVTGRGRAAIENHFSPDPELMATLGQAHRRELGVELDFSRLDLNIQYTSQQVPRGLGDAILHAESFAGDEPFVVALGDSIIGLRGPSLACRRMAATFARCAADVVVGVEEVALDRVSLYGIVKPAGSEETFPVETIVEKPSPDVAPSRLAVAGRYVFSPTIFRAVRETASGAKGEVQITDAIRLIAEQGGTVLGVKLRPDEQRFDIGNLPGYFEAFIEFAAADRAHGPRIRQHLRRILDRYQAEHDS